MGRRFRVHALPALALLLALPTSFAFVVNVGVVHPPLGHQAMLSPLSPAAAVANRSSSSSNNRSGSTRNSSMCLSTKNAQGSLSGDRKESVLFTHPRTTTKNEKRSLLMTSSMSGESCTPKASSNSDTPAAPATSTRTRTRLQTLEIRVQKW